MYPDTVQVFALIISSHSILTATLAGGAIITPIWKENRKREVSTLPNNIQLAQLVGHDLNPRLLDSSACSLPLSFLKI